jgi:hypothetical protein
MQKMGCPCQMDKGIKTLNFVEWPKASQKLEAKVAVPSYKTNELLVRVYDTVLLHNSKPNMSCQSNNACNCSVQNFMTGSPRLINSWVKLRPFHVTVHVHFIPW